MKIFFQTVLYNLLSSALEYRSPERTLGIRIRCQKQGDHHVLPVTDNALGVSINQVEKIFTLFKRFHTQVPGTGMGLHIVKRWWRMPEEILKLKGLVNAGSPLGVYSKQ